MEITELLALAVKQNASDIHLLPELPPLFRMHGELQNVPDHPPLSADEVKRLIFSVLSEDQQNEFEICLQFDIALSFTNIGNFRVSVFHQLRGIAAVFRVIPEKVPTFEELHLPSVLKSLLVLSNGLVLVTGPAGSGKSTTLAAMVEYINAVRASHIITIEDPIEYIFTSKRSAINQIQLTR